VLWPAGFARVLGRWDLRLPSEGGRLHAWSLRAVRADALTKLLADVACEGWAFLALKPNGEAHRP
jgi:hypothetical protein